MQANGGKGVLRAPVAHTASPAFSARDRKGPGAAAVCAFSISDVKEAFDGLYKEVNRETQQWYTDVHPVPEPRPGAVSGFHCLSLFISSLFG